MKMGEFRPLVSGAHAQTVLGQCIRTGLRWPYRSHDVVLEPGAGVRLLLRASWQPGTSDRPAIVLVHGLEGSDRARYLVSTGIEAFRQGWHVIRMNMRGCGDALSLCPRLYNAGLTTDLLAVFDWLTSQPRVTHFATCGFSLGAGLTLLTLSQHERELPPSLIGAVAVCPPLDMSRAADALELRPNRFYGRRFTRSLCASYRKRQTRAGGIYEAGRERGIRTLREFDDVITAHYAGYRDAEHYYQEVSAGPRLRGIHRPVLVLSSDNDPFIPLESIAEWPASSFVHLEVTKNAGHVGFIGATRAPRWFWAAERTMRFVDEIASRQ